MEVHWLASSHTNQCQHYYTLENLLPQRALGLNTFNHLQTYQMSYVFHLSDLDSKVLSKFLAEHVKDLFEFLILVASSFVEAPWLPTVLNM